MQTTFKKIQGSNSLLAFFFILFLMAGCNTQNPEQKPDDYQYSQDAPVEGQIHTAKRLKQLMDEKKYEDAIKLFSRAQQTNIKAVQQNPESFKYWCSVWTLDEAQLDKYIAMIKSGKGPFVFEDGEWKIDER